MRNLIIGLIIFGLLMPGLFGCKQEPETLRMAVVPAAGVIEEVEKMQPIIDYLSEYIGMPIEPIACTGYTAVIVALRIGDCDIVRVGPFSYLLAVQEADAIPLVHGIKAETGQDAYHSLFITHPGTGIENLQDLKGHTFAFGSVASTSGYLIPSAIFEDAGIDIETDLEASHLTSHATIIEAVRTHQVDAGACADNRLEDALKSGALEEGEITVIHTSGPIPTSPTVCRPDLDPTIQELIIQAYLNMPPEIAAHEAGGLSGYVRAYDKDYDFLREVAKVLDLDLTK